MKDEIKNPAPKDISAWRDMLFRAESEKYGFGGKCDLASSRRLYRLLAAAGDRRVASLGQYNLGVFYYYGLGVRRDFKKAFSCFVKSAMLFPDRRATRKIADMYRYGEYVPRNETIAARFYLRSLSETEITI